MRNAVIGIVIGTVIGVVIGAGLLAPHLVAHQPAFSAAQQMENLAPAGSPATTTAAAPPGETPNVSWQMASAYSGSLPQIGTMAKRIEKEIWRVSGGNMEIRFNEPDTLVPTADLFDAVASGAVDAAFSSPGLWRDKDPALALFGAVPFGPDADEYLAWIYFGGGRQLYEDIYHKHGIHGVFCGILGPEASGWFHKPILTVGDLKGLRIRIYGLGADVLKKLGAIPEMLPDTEILRAMDSGAIDAAEFSMPAVDLKLGLNRVANHYYFPGWHQPATLFDLMINLSQWNALSSTAKARIQSVCGDNIRYELAQSGAIQFAALKEIYAKGVKIHVWPKEILAALKQAWTQVAAERSQANADFRRVWDSLSAFRRDYSIWKDLAYPAPRE